MYDAVSRVSPSPRSPVFKDDIVSLSLSLQEVNRIAITVCYERGCGAAGETTFAGLWGNGSGRSAASVKVHRLLCQCAKTVGWVPGRLKWKFLISVC